ncbi:hypothetical protein C8J57DRAFT_1485867 [Mycena rebaudengoi]|nr:hypothetical protein C8J57DRAFT_1485867 [Mycena rebaudengoi]
MPDGVRSLSDVFGGDAGGHGGVASVVLDVRITAPVFAVVWVRINQAFTDYTTNQRKFLSDIYNDNTNTSHAAFILQQRNSRSSMDTYYYPTPSPSSHASSILAAALQMPTPPPPAIPPASSAASPLPVTRHNTPVGPVPVYKYYGLDYDESASTVDDVLQPLMLPSSPPRGYLDFLYRELSVEEDVFGPVRHITTESKPRFSAAHITREKQHRTLMWVLRQRQDDRK